MGSSPRAGTESTAAAAAAQLRSGARKTTSAADPGRTADALLVRRCRAGEESAWTAIVERFSSYVYAITLGFGLRGDRAEDVFQEVFLRAFTRLDTLRDEGALKPWIAQLTRRAAIDRLRADRREQPSLDDAEIAVADSDLERIELAMTVRRSLDQLPAPFDEALARFFLKDQSYRTIGDALGIPAGTVASRISRGLSMLREILDGAGPPAA